MGAELASRSCAPGNSQLDDEIRVSGACNRSRVFGLTIEPFNQACLTRMQAFAGSKLVHAGTCDHDTSSFEISLHNPDKPKNCLTFYSVYVFIYIYTLI